MDAIDAALEAGYSPVKVNVCVMKGFVSTLPTRSEGESMHQMWT